MATDLQIPLHEVQRRLALDNPWWRAGEGIDPQEAAWPRRAFARPQSSTTVSPNSPTITFAGLMSRWTTWRLWA